MGIEATDKVYRSLVSIFICLDTQEPNQKLRSRQLNSQRSASQSLQLYEQEKELDLKRRHKVFLSQA